MEYQGSAMCARSEVVFLVDMIFAYMQARISIELAGSHVLHLVLPRAFGGILLHSVATNGLALLHLGTYWHME